MKRCWNAVEMLLIPAFILKFATLSCKWQSNLQKMLNNIHLSIHLFPTFSSIHCWPVKIEIYDTKHSIILRYKTVFILYVYAFRYISNIMHDFVVLLINHIWCILMLEQVALLTCFIYSLIQQEKILKEYYERCFWIIWCLLAGKDQHAAY